MRIKLNWSVNSLAISKSSLRQEFRGILGLSNIKSICRMSDFKIQEVAEMSIKSICRMSDFKIQEVAEMSKIFYLKLLTEKNLEFLNATVRF